MPDAASSLPRLHVDAPLGPGGEAALDAQQFNYLKNVLRFTEGDQVLVFNGRDGEWRARFRAAGKRAGTLLLETQVRGQPAPGDLWYVFAPLKHARLDYMVQKAAEMGVTRLQPVLTRRTQVSRVNLERMRANAIEAAEQCGVLTIPEVEPEVTLERLIDGFPNDRRLIFCDESAPSGSPIGTLQALPRGKLALLIGPEGGFDPHERARLLAMPGIAAISLGPRILRADTAAVAALALAQACLGDWAGTF